MKAFITGITGQDGGYLAELLLGKGYEVTAIMRRNAGNDVSRIQHLLDNKNLDLRYGDLTDASSLQNLFNHIRFDEVYNLAAQSHVRISFDIPDYTGDVNALGTVRLLEAIKNSGAIEHTRFYQASTSELYGKVIETPQNEKTPFYPRSPYGVAKLYSYWIVKNYRESYGLHGSNGILFNHESPWRGDDFVTQKIIKGVADIHKGKKTKISLGNLDAKRDWGHAKDYVKGMWKMLQHSEGDDYVLATGKLNSVRNLVETAFKKININIIWGGSGLHEVGVDEYGTVYVDVNADFYRPAEVDLLLGDSTKAKRVLGWQPKYTFKEMIDEMMEAVL